MILTEKLPCSRFRGEMVLCFERFGVEDIDNVLVEKGDTEGSSITP